MPKKVIKTNKAPAPVGPYSQAIEVNNLLFISGQIPFDNETGELVKGDITKATSVVLNNIKSILEEANYSLDDVVRCTVFLKDMAKFSEMNDVYAKFFIEKPPARVAVEVARLPKDVDIEISAIASRS